MFGLLGFRLYTLGYAMQYELAKAAVAQRYDASGEETSRGIIYDANLMPLTSSVTGIERFAATKLARHTLGFITDTGEGFGLEKAFDALLTRENSGDTIVNFNDARGEPIPGLSGVIPGEANYSGLAITLDYHMQQIAERAMDENNVVAGACIIADALTAEIKAIVSRPNFEPLQMADYLNSDAGELINRALLNYDIGSTFKIVMTIAALEHGIAAPDTEFECVGYTMVDGMSFPCNRKEGHGKVTLVQGFALSCNSVYFELGQRLGYDIIVETAQRLGFFKPVIGIKYMNEQAGNMPKGEVSTYPRAVANMSIGQGSLQATPLQIARLITTIVSGGIDRQLGFIKGYVAESGEPVLARANSSKRIMSEQIAQTLQAMMVETVRSGTGKAVYIEGAGAGGKTGSAESGISKEGETLTHGWFAGFFPERDPQYVVVVVAEGGGWGSLSAAPVFRQIQTMMTND